MREAIGGAQRIAGGRWAKILRGGKGNPFALQHFGE
jgi:hypothetical protein